MLGYEARRRFSENDPTEGPRKHLEDRQIAFLGVIQITAVTDAKVMLH